MDADNTVRIAMQKVEKAIAVMSAAKEDNSGFP